MLIANLTHSGLTRALASELGEKNVRVNVLVPGYIKTDMTEGMCHFFIGNYFNALRLGLDPTIPPLRPDLF